MKPYIESIDRIKENQYFKDFKYLTIEDYGNILEYQKSIIFQNMRKRYFMYVSNLELTNLNKIFDCLVIIAISSLKWLSIITKKDEEAIIQENHTLFENKNSDYGNSFTDFGIIGIIVRLNDKINRILNLTKKSKTMRVDEKVEDTINDLYNYCMIGLMFE
uniref:Nucleotide Modification Associated Domain-Containing Protein n=1 Tax=Florenciella sp. virus SA2 TaxID=3240092 RepID=A0AB39JB22_9VIRU